jgi:hypothetical protein
VSETQVPNLTDSLAVFARRVAFAQFVCFASRHSRHIIVTAFAAVVGIFNLVRPASVWLCQALLCQELAHEHITLLSRPSMSSDNEVTVVLLSDSLPPPDSEECSWAFCWAECV